MSAVERREFLKGAAAIGAVTTTTLAGTGPVAAGEDRPQPAPGTGGCQRGKVAAVTGAARGIGRASAVALAREGADVVVIDVCAPVLWNSPISRQGDGPLSNLRFKLSGVPRDERTAFETHGSPAVTP